MQACLPNSEAALFFYESLNGPPEEELEHASLERIKQRDGIDWMLDQLRTPLQEKKIYLKRKFLADYESIGRSHGESLRDYCNRHLRTEKALESVDIKVEGMYDSEARGNRLLDRARLSTDNQRTILIGSRRSLTFDDLRESMNLQFPDHKAAPSLHGRDGAPIERRQQSGPAAAGKGGYQQRQGQPPRNFQRGGFKGSGKRSEHNAEHAECEEDPDFEDAADDKDDAGEKKNLETLTMAETTGTPTRRRGF